VRRPLLLTSPVAHARRLVGSLPGVDLPWRLQGRTVMVTGASSGIGEATAKACAARGARVLLVARRADELRRVAVDITETGGIAHCYPCDLTDEESVDQLVKAVLAEHGVVDMLVNNAGRSIRRSIESSYDRMHDYERSMSVNFFGPVRLMLGLLPAMADQGFGHVVNVVSWGVTIKAPKFSAYLASKSALDVFSRVVGRELYGDGVTFTNLRMSLVRTEMIGPTGVYHRTPAMTPQEAARLVVRALEDRPVTMDTMVGRVVEVANLAVPRLSDAVSHHLAKLFPESPAARRHLERD
jgi:short-subunit dehydrogenase